MASNMEALSFVLRRGGQAADFVPIWQHEQTEEAVLALKAQGVNTVLISLMKGAGFAAEHDDIEAARRYVELAHKHGLKVGGYIGGSLFHETMFAEEPDSPNWIQRDELGRPLFYNPNQTFRYMGNRNHPGYQDFIHRVLRLGIEDLKMDFFHFDQMMWWRLPYVSHTPVDQERFRAYIARRYPVERMRARFGFSSLGHLILPEFGIGGSLGASAEVVNPLLQDLINFRSETLADQFREYDQYARGLNPNVALQANSPLDMSSNNAVMYGVDVPRLLAHGATVTSEERNEPQYSSDGRLVSRIRTFRACRTMGKPVLFWQQPATIVGRPAHHVLKSDEKLRLAEAMAFCDNCLGLTAGLDVGNVLFAPPARKYVDFYWKRNELLAGAESAAEVAVLRSFASTELNAAAVLPSVMLFEQTLIQSGIPFDVIFDQQLNDLSRYRVLVLANQDALSDGQADSIARYVRSGGSVIATGDTSLYTEWRLRRPRLALAEVFGLDVPPDAAAPNQPLRRTAGKGRVVYLPRIEPVRKPPPAQLYYTFPNEHWKLPANRADLVAAVTWALASPRLTASVPDWVAVEATRQPAKHRFLVHLVNYKVSAPVFGITLKLRVPRGRRLLSVIAESPDADGPATLPVSVSADQASVQLPRLETYSVLVFQLATGDTNQGRQQ
jgi:hypothetical protein